AAAAQAEVDHVGGRGVVGHARHRAARRPGRRIDDVGLVAAALAEHAHRLHRAAEGHAGHAAAVVGGRADGAGHVRAVPAAVLGDAEDVAFARMPVARIVGIGIAAVAIDAHLGVDDEVVAGDVLADQFGVRRAAGIEHG